MKNNFIKIFFDWKQKIGEYLSSCLESIQSDFKKSYPYLYLKLDLIELNLPDLRGHKEMQL